MENGFSSTPALVTPIRNGISNVRDLATDIPEARPDIYNLLTAIFISLIFSQSFSTFAKAPAAKPQKRWCGRCAGSLDSGLWCPQMKNTW